MYHSTNGVLHSCSNVRQRTSFVPATFSFDFASPLSWILMIEKDFLALNITLLEGPIPRVHSELTVSGTVSCEFSQ